jgi:predicted RNA-binding Zn-ribbon protein involved in translation (DUF1610 family)
MRTETEMDIIARDDDGTTCGKCGVNIMLIATLVDHNEEECPNCGQRYRVYER